MNYLNNDQIQGAECSNDAVMPSELLLKRLEENNEKLRNDQEITSTIYCNLLLDNGYILLDLGRNEEAWHTAHEAFTHAVDREAWEQTVQACDIIYTADQSDAIKALAHGIWLGVTYPIDPELSVAMLQHLVEETPDNSDGAAVAAAAANYIVDLRTEGKAREELKFFASQLLGQVARRHGQVDEQEVFEFWVERMELDDPAKFLPRLAKMLDVLVEKNEWWFDRDALRDKLPKGE